MTTSDIFIAHDWRGESLAPPDVATLNLTAHPNEMRVAIEAPFHDDPPPPGEPASCDRLWEFEVVELFLLGDDDHYLEIEFSPHGHYLVLQLHGRRQVVRQGLALDYRCRRAGDRWSGEAKLPREWLPVGLHAFNAYRIHGVDDGRCHHAAHPTPGAVPDFHALEKFGPWPLRGAFSDDNICD